MSGSRRERVAGYAFSMSETGSPLPAREVEEALARLHRAQAELNACTFIDDRAGTRGGPAVAGGPLAGMPIVLKDLIDQEGLPTTCGSGFLREPAAASAPLVKSLEAAGATIVARSGLHEFAYGFSSENPWFGPVRNPWDPATSPGGSSGGSAVAVAAGLVPAAIGTDTGGSIRVPAAMTGIFGLKVTHGRVSTAGVFPLAASLDTVGPLARDVATLDRVYRVLAGVPAPLRHHDLDGARIGVPVQWIQFPSTETGVARGFSLAAARLEDMGAVVVPIDDARLAPWGMIQELAGAEAAHVHRRFRAEGKPYGAELAARLDVAEKVSPALYLEAHRWRASLVEAFAAALRDVDLLITPAVAARRKVIGNDLIAGEAYRPVLSWFSALVNHAGLPAVALPLIAEAEPGFRGPPPSLQLISAWWQEDLLLGVAAHLEAEGLVGFQAPPIYFE
jgi:aspartyl-tRNA(Asn)/glutamyl-tRNA(Gln) amidotransferase subunit A